MAGAWAAAGPVQGALAHPRCLSLVASGVAPGPPPMLRAGDRLYIRQRAEQGPTRVARRCSQADGSPGRPIVPKAVERLFEVEFEST
jgi:hypothetical protein